MTHNRYPNYHLRNVLFCRCPVSDMGHGYFFIHSPLRLIVAWPAGTFALQDNLIIHHLIST